MCRCSLHKIYNRGSSCIAVYLKFPSGLYLHRLPVLFNISECSLCTLKGKICYPGTHTHNLIHLAQYAIVSSRLIASHTSLPHHCSLEIKLTDHSHFIIYIAVMKRYSNFFFGVFYKDRCYIQDDSLPSKKTKQILI